VGGICGFYVSSATSTVEAAWGKIERNTVEGMDYGMRQWVSLNPQPECFIKNVMGRFLSRSVRGEGHYRACKRKLWP
jgi:hypothetical protein